MRTLLLLLALWGVAPQVVPAQTAPPAVEQIAPSSPLPVRPAPPRTLRAHWHVFVAFALAWALLFGYVLSLGRRFARLERDIQGMHGAP
ncbi:MAG: CcmD family protein [Gemmatimonadetes bacterium]|nr:CcmD family protein [Gemmatimonadota bacterium]